MSAHTITITHTSDEGTLATGDTRSYAATLKACRWRWGRSITAWFIPNSRDRYPKESIIAETVTALESAGATVVLNIARATVDTAIREANRSERIDDRRDALAAKAARKAAESTARYEASHAIASMIPFGQPILVGHHSERGHRRDLDRIRRHMDASCELHSESVESARKAEASEDHNAHRLTGPATLRRIERLETELRRLRRIFDEHRAHAETPWYRDLGHKIAEHEADIDYWRGHLAALEDAGLKVWGPADFQPGDIVFTVWGPKRVVRVNPKTLSVESGYSWTDKIPYDRVKGRAPAATMTGG